MDRLLSVIVPCYNEAATLRPLLEAVARQPCVREILVVDDASTDGTREALKAIAAAWPAEAPPLRPIYAEQNQGKSEAIRTGLAAAGALYCVVQDADLEYDPGDFPRLLQPLLAGRADVVYGTRYPGRPHSWHAFANRVLTRLSNLATGLRLTDMETCYKVFPTGLLKSLPLRASRYGFEPEVTALLARRGSRFVEVPIAYRPRGYAEGKKIGWKDALQAVGLILKHALRNQDLFQKPRFILDKPPQDR